ncbi:MAG: hypothetical protein JWO19_3684 [Bryobacterales bacterium]|jgi:acyl carrier protein|nr:hypothetical protein [Bryobacterales bacterium]
MPGNETSEALVREIGKLMAEKLLVDVASPEQDLLAGGVLDSLTLIQLLVNLEQHFGVRIPLEELQIEDIRSLQALAHLVETHKLHSPAPVTEAERRPSLNVARQGG